MPYECLCIGGSATDASFRLVAPTVLGTSNVASSTVGFGGVARNVAESLARLGVTTGLLTAVGADSAGWELIDHLSSVGVDAGLVQVLPGEATSRYIAVLDPDGELVIGVNSMDVIAQLRPADIADAPLEDASWVFAECNLAVDTLAAVIDRRRAGGAFGLAIDAISVAKATRLPEDLTGVDLLCANADEANAILGVAEPATREGALSLARALAARGAGAAIVSIGSGGCVVATANQAWSIDAVPAQVVDVTGAGDARIAGTISALLADAPIEVAAQLGSLLAALTTESPYTIDPALSRQRIDSLSGRLAEASITGLLP
jgi:pseudouridine kinase